MVAIEEALLPSPPFSIKIVCVCVCQCSSSTATAGLVGPCYWQHQPGGVTNEHWVVDNPTRLVVSAQLGLQGSDGCQQAPPSLPSHTLFTFLLFWSNFEIIIFLHTCFSNRELMVQLKHGKMTRPDTP